MVSNLLKNVEWLKPFRLLFYPSMILQNGLFEFPFLRRADCTQHSRCGVLSLFRIARRLKESLHTWLFIPLNDGFFARRVISSVLRAASGQ
jgi:hypothetical protein